MFRFFTILLFSCISVTFVTGHGMMLKPVNRASRWRYNKTAPINWNDNELFCGGFGIQYGFNGGKCGFCGDDFRKPIPRPHEHGGEYGQGVIVEKYKTEQIITVLVNLTTNHKGSFKFDICKMDGKKTENDACFVEYPLKLSTGIDKFVLPHPKSSEFNVNLQLPAKLKCNHCVLRWIYRTGNSWGHCEDGSEAIGCGEQEEFRSCSDISII